MALILICNDKGGVGKSTVAPEFAVYLFDLGNSVAVIDADKSLASAKHIHSAEPQIPVGALFDVAQIEKTVPKLLEKHEFIIADAPANLGDETRALMTLADVVLIPTEPALKAFEGTLATYQLVEKCREVTGGNPEQVHVVFNKVKMNRKKKYFEYRRQAEAANLPVTNAFIRMRAALEDMEETNTTVSRMKSTQETRDAQADLTAVFAEVFHSMVKAKKRVANG